MTESRFWELANREIDEELSEAERTELDSFGQQNPELAACRAELRRVSGLLGDVDEVEAPDNMRSYIARAVDGRTPHPQNVTPVRPGFWSFWSRISLRQTYAFAGGAVVGAALLALVFKMAPGSLPINNGDLTGTILFRNQHSDFMPAVTTKIKTPEAVGSIELATLDNLVTIRVNLTSDRPVQLEVQFAPEQLSATGFSSLESHGAPVSIGRTDVRLEHTGTNQYDLVWSRVGSEATALHVILRTDDVIFAHSLAIDGSGQ